MITFASEQIKARSKVMELCASISKDNNARIIDVGGAAKSWLSPYVIHVMDIQSQPKHILANVSYMQADINNLEA